ncbi:MAG: hypothetical protein CTY29_02835 [Methylobacter sp.]|nr:MAG: hypothetical protein CTY29_02835 [Methylobacter sp.]
MTLVKSIVILSLNRSIKPMKQINIKRFLARFSCVLLLIAQPVPAANDWIYVVKQGDNLWDLAREYLIDIAHWHQLQQLNNIADPYHIPPGTKLRVPIRWISQSPILARIGSLHGQATLIEGGGQEESSLTQGTFVFKGDAILTKADSTLLLEFVDGSTLLLQPNSRLELSHLNIYGKTGMVDTRLRLNQGRVETKVEKKQGPASRFEISTPASITSVRGTDYRVGSEATEQQSFTEVLEGGVNLKSGGNTKLISGGYGAVAKANQPPSAPISLLEAIDTQALPSEYGRNPVQFTLPNDANTKGYRVQIAKDRAFTEVIFDRQYNSYLIRGPELEDADYFAHIRAIDENGLEGKNADYFFTVNARPEAPIMQEPKPEAGLTEETPAFIWARQQDINQYHFQLAKDKAFKDLVVDLPALSEAGVNSGYQLQLGQYFWRVASISSTEGHGPFSDPQTFKRVVPPPQAEEPEISDTTLVLNWPADLPGSQYHFQMAKDQAFTEIVYDKQVDAAKVELDRPEGGEYYIRVSTLYADGFKGPFGKPQIIDVPDSGWYWWLLTVLPFALFAL